MNRYTKSVLALAALLALLPLVVFAQKSNVPQFFRPYDQRGLAAFESTRIDTIGFDEFEVYWGGAFTQQFQMLDHSHDAQADPDGDGENENAIPELGAGFNLATANLNLDAQLADGVRVNLVTYLSSRHHAEAWVKGGYLQVDRLTFLGNETIDDIFRFVRLRLGHFEINYGDAHFRRTDNGNAIFNPFVGNYILDSFATEIGGEVYVFASDFLVMGGVTGGEIKGAVTRPDDRAPSIYGKVGYDSDITEDLRIRLTGSVYTTSKSLNNTLYAGDRAGSRYYEILPGDFRTPRVNPVINDHVTAIQINPFVKFGGLELFGVIETATGGVDNEGEGDNEDRTWNQIAVEGIYRFLPREQLYVGARYNTVSGTTVGAREDVTINRIQVGAGWFATPNLLLKLEYVDQTWDGYNPTSIFHGGEMSGLMIEGVLAF